MPHRSNGFRHLAAIVQQQCPRCLHGQVFATLFRMHEQGINAMDPPIQSFLRTTGGIWAHASGRREFSNTLSKTWRTQR